MNSETRMRFEANIRKLSDMSKLNDSGIPDRLYPLKRRIIIMPDRKLRLLIAEKEYLIAIDVRQTLSDLLPCDVTIATMLEMDERLAEGGWDLVLVDVASDAEQNRRGANMILANGAGLVFLTGHTDLACGIADFAEWPVVIKPFENAALLGAVFRALSLVGKA